jgi:hypothetical protein
MDTMERLTQLSKVVYKDWVKYRNKSYQKTLKGWKTVMINKGVVKVNIWKEVLSDMSKVWERLKKIDDAITDKHRAHQEKVTLKQTIFQ